MAAIYKSAFSKQINEKWFVYSLVDYFEYKANF
jgi:hypothetical protein